MRRLLDFQIRLLENELFHIIIAVKFYLSQGNNCKYEMDWGIL